MFTVTVVDADGWRDWLAAVPRAKGGSPNAENRAHVLAIGETPLRWQEPGPFVPMGGFTWICPGCGGIWGALLNLTPISGPNPRYVNSGTFDKPTLEPDLECPLHAVGRCEGLWHLAGGELSKA